MNKEHLHRLIHTQLTERYQRAAEAAQQAYETATHEENVAENKYDTLGLEASYLAEGQSRRVFEAEQAQQEFSQLSVRDFSEDDAIHYGALVELEEQSGACRWVFLSPVAGGLSINYDELEILLLTAEAPLGKVLLGAFLDDEVAFNGQSYLVKSIA